MDIERRALYTALRLNWLNDPTLELEPWQVENYRDMSLPLIFSRLKNLGFHFDKESFSALSENYDSPEEFVDDLFADEEPDPRHEDQVYLLIFELWRRFEKEKPSLSIFCEELDHQITLYDQGAMKTMEEIQDLLGKLQLILQENSEEGADPESILQVIGRGSANDIEGFLLDFIAEQIESGNYSYAEELLENFSPYIADKKWFELQKLRLSSHLDPIQAISLLESLSETAMESKDLEFVFEVLSESVYEGEKDLFIQLVRHAITLLKTEIDLKDLAAICIEFLRLSDNDRETENLEKLIEKRSHIPEDHPFSPKDPIIEQMLISLRSPE